MIPPFMPKKAITLQRNLNALNNKGLQSNKYKKEKNDIENSDDYSDEDKQKKNKSNKKKKVTKNKDSSDDFSDKEPEDSLKVERRYYYHLYSLLVNEYFITNVNI